MPASVTVIKLDFVNAIGERRSEGTLKPMTLLFRLISFTDLRLLLVIAYIRLCLAFGEAASWE